jgi:hypothetical protein
MVYNNSGLWNLATMFVNAFFMRYKSRILS